MPRATISSVKHANIVLSDDYTTPERNVSTYSGIYHHWPIRVRGHRTANDRNFHRSVVDNIIVCLQCLPPSFPIVRKSYLSTCDIFSCYVCASSSMCVSLELDFLAERSSRVWKAPPFKRFNNLDCLMNHQRLNTETGEYLYMYIFMEICRFRSE